MKCKKGTVRAMTAGIMMILFLVFFLDVHPPFTGFLGQIMAWIQFSPALINAISGSFKGIIAFLLLVLLCLGFGRIYCAVLCPLGIFQDAMIFLSRHRGKQVSKGKITKNILRTGTFVIAPSATGTYPFLWYAIMIMTTTILLSGSLFLVNLLDPFSIFGRFSNQMVLPVGGTLKNLLVALSESFGKFSFSPVTLRPVLWSVFWVTYGWLILVIFMSFYHGRLYCNTLCPVGAFFSLLSRSSFFRFTIDRQKCTTCGKCQRICRSQCMDPASGTIDGARCVSCFDCMDVCPENAIGYKITPRYSLVPGQFGPDFVKKSSLSGAGGKRKFLVTSLAVCTGVLATSLSLRPLLARMARVGTRPHDPITPPGSLGLDHFSHTCLGCHACVNACVENVLLPRANAYGLTGALQPHLDFSISRCAYTCHACTRVCPSGAILPLSLEEKQRTRIGSVHFEKDKCLVYTQKRDCGACAEVCPTHAVHTILENNIHYPRLKLDACIGCGACQLVCPVNPKAIYVVAVRVHEKAGPPFFSPGESAVPSKIMGEGDAFPF